MDVLLDTFTHIKDQIKLPKLVLTIGIGSLKLKIINHINVEYVYL